MNGTFRMVFAAVFLVVAFVSSRFIHATPEGFRRAYAKNPQRAILLQFVIPVLLIVVLVAFLTLSPN